MFLWTTTTDDVKTGLELETSCFSVTDLDDSLALNEML
jgi:hypothetical protein